jgi:hypothetical protein
MYKNMPGVLLTIRKFVNFRENFCFWVYYDFAVIVHRYVYCIRLES